MTQKILGPEGSKRRKRFWLVPMLAALFAVVFYVAGAQAVHDAGIFQLDKNASTAVNPPPTALEDWDLICKAHPVSAAEPAGCTFAAGYAQPAGTTTATASSFKVDPSESSQDDILKGGTKDDNDINSWKWASAKPSPPKNDITHGYAAEYTATVAQGGVSVGDKILYFGADRFSNSGSANIAFWFFQKDVATAGAAADGTCAAGAGCPFSGTHTVGNVSLGGSTPGDILVISAFGPKAAINVYEWVGPGNATSPCFTNNCSLQPIVTGGQACEDVTNDNACATVNDVSVPSPWTVNQKTGGADQFAPTNFFEGGINLTKLKVDACISSFLVNTRASASGDAELHDMIIGKFDRCTPALTTQASTNATNVLPGATGIFDRATIQVSGATNPADATGSVTFYLCPAATPDCTSPQVGTAVTLSNADCDPVSGSNTDGKSCAKSATTTAPTTPGKYCFRAVADLTNYGDPDPYTDTTNECFTVVKHDSGTVTVIHAGAGAADLASAPAITSADIGSTVHDKATVTGTAAGGIPTGNVTFTWYTTQDCTGTGTPKGTVDLDANGVAHPSGDQVVPVGGGSFQATYNGSTTYNTSTGACEPLTATKLDSGTVTVIHAGAGAADLASAPAITSADIGSTVHDKATVTGTAAGGIPTGNVTFTWYTTQDCTGTGTPKGTVDLDANGVAHPSGDQVVPVGGGSFQATYNGSTTYNTSTGACEPLIATKLPTSISTAQDWYPQDTATITPAVAGTVVFSLYENGTCAGAPVDTFTDTSAPFGTSQTTHHYTANQAISWSATFTPTDTATYQSSTTTRCERSDLTINNSASVFPPAP